MASFKSECRFCARDDPDILQHDVKNFVNEIQFVAQFEVSKIIVSTKLNHGSCV